MCGICQWDQGEWDGDEVWGLGMNWPADVELAGFGARLEMLSQDHAPALCEACVDGALHRLWYTTVPAPEGMSAEIERRLALRAQGSMLPFAILRAGHAVGMTTYMNIDATNRRLEIGSTWYRASVQRSGLNTAVKFLMLRHAFEALDCLAVEFRTHVLNAQSRRAIERLGAKLDGILRQHIVMPDGSIRDTAVYSITAAEWPMVRSHLTWQMEKPREDAGASGQP